MKLIKYISLFIITISLLMFSSCDIMKKDATEEDINNLLKAIEQLETGSYTSEQTNKETITITKKILYEETKSQTIVYDTKYKKEGNKEYSVYTKDSGTPVEFYSETINDKVYKYVNKNDQWTDVSYNHHQSAEYTTLEYYKFLITKDSILIRDNIYYGIKEEVSRLLYLNITGGREDDETTVIVDKFEVKVENSKVTKFELEYTYIYSFTEGYTTETYELKFQIETKYYDHDNTIITSPIL